MARVLYVLFWLVVCGLFLWKLPGNKFEAAPSAQAAPAAVPPSNIELSAATPAPRKQKKLGFSATGVRSPKELKTLTLEQLSPTLSDVRQEAIDNPHATPESLLEFAANMSRKMEPALQSEEAARSLIQELESCAMEKDGVASAQGLCLHNAYRLAKKYPKLESDYEKMARAASPEAVRLSKFVQ